MGRSSKNQKPTNNLDFVREKVFQAFPGLQLLASNVIDKACCFSYAIPMDDDEYDLDNSILHCEAFDELEQEQQQQQQKQQQHQQQQYETTLVASKSLTERTASIPKGANYVYLDAANPSLTDDVGERSAFYFKSPSLVSTHTATTYCKSYGSTSSIFSHQSCSTIAWSDLEDDSDCEDEDDLEIRSPPVESAKTLQQQQQRRKPPTTPQTKKTSATTTSTTQSGGASLVRRWSGVDKDISETVVTAPPAHFYRDVMVIRRVQSESLSELPYLSKTVGYQV